jgi:ABC-type Fe3+/spermidine/putrescine transport system ATPase subunit
MARLTIEQVSKAYHGTTVLQPLDLDVPDGSFCCMLGSSGSGKSTLLRIVAGLTEPDGGSVHIGDRDVTRLSVERRNIGVVFQNYALFPHLSARSNVAFGLRARGVGRREARRRADEQLELVGLGPHADRAPSQLSGGQQQRVALARALVTSPDLLLLDEPLSALDRKIRGEMQAELKRVHRETGLTTVMVTHDQDEALDLADQVIMLDQGIVAQHGRPAELYESPVSAFVASFLGAFALGTGTVSAGAIEIGGVTLSVPRLALPAGSAAEVLVRSERVLVNGGDGHAGIVRAVDFHGAIARIAIVVGELEVPATVLAQDAADIRVGDAVTVSLVPGSLHIYPSKEAFAGV